MNSIDEIMKLVIKTLPGYACVVRLNSDGSYNATLMHAQSLLKNLKMGVNKFSASSEVSGLVALQAAYSWACHYRETKQVLAHYELIKKPVDNSVDP